MTGRSRKNYEVRDEGVYDLDKGDWVLYAPMRSRREHQQFLDLITDESSESDPDHGNELLGLTYGELVEDRERMDRVARALSIELDCDYIAALERLDDWFSLAVTGREPATLGEALESTHVSLDQFSDDVKRLDQADEARKEQQADEVAAEVNDAGQVMLADDVGQAARLLTDPFEIERAYLEACQLDGKYRGEAGRREFEDDLRLHTEAGVDMVATMRANRTSRRGPGSGSAQPRHGWEQREREERARKKGLMQDISEKLGEL